MFTQCILELDTGDEMLTYNKAVLLQSIIMEQLPLEYVEELHLSKLHSYSQAVVCRDNHNYWVISTTNQETSDKIISRIMAENFSKFTLNHNNLSVKIKNKTLHNISKKEFLDKYFFGESQRYIKVQFQTPTAFKSQGRYVFYPDLYLIYNSLMNKYDESSVSESLKSEELLDELVKYSEIVNYNLRSTSYSIGKAKIPAFTGSITIKVNGPQTLINFANTIMQFGEYSGVGIKSAMGMGKIKIN